MKSSTKSCYYKQKEGKKIRVCQGDIFKDVKYFLWIDLKDDKIEGEELIVPYLVVLSQECDLDLDYKNRIEEKENHDKCLQSILVTPAYLSQKLRYGEHLEELNLKMRHIPSDPWKKVKTNQNARYHFLPSYNEYNIPELVIDFKHYYTIPREYFYQHFENHYIGTIDQLFRESLSQRFTYYLSRIGLPTIKE